MRYCKSQTNECNNYEQMRKYLSMISLVLTLASFNSKAQTSKASSEQKVFQDIQESHIDANVPDSAQFNSLLKRDLQKYFYPEYGEITVKWDFLRNGPTQTGVSYPKYYLWVKISKEEELVSEGAVRIAAIEKTSFDVTNYIEIGEIRNKSKDIYTIFPKAVCEKIESRLK